MDQSEPYVADASLRGKLRRRAVRLLARRPARRSPQRPMISFSFDDAPATAVGIGAQILEGHGLRGTYFVSAGLADTHGPMGRYAGQAELMALAAKGHELACHTFSHLDCGRARAAAISADIERNRLALDEWGAPAAATFAYPYGDVSLDAKQVLQRRYGLLRGLHPGLIEAGVDLNQAPAVGVEGPDGESRARRWLWRAAERKAWLILYSHDVDDQPSPWGCTPGALAALVKLAVDGGFDVVTVAEGVRRLS